MYNSQTVKNMELVLDNAIEEIKARGYHQAKTLMNTYCTLLKQLRDNLDSYANKLPYKNELLDQERKVTKLHEEASNLISMELANRDYKSADNITLIVDRLLKSKRELFWILGTESRYMNLPQNKAQEKPKPNRLKQVAIFGSHLEIAKEKYEEIKSKFHVDELKQEVNRATEIILTTKDLRITALRYSDSFRGLRLDEIYVDKNLKIADLHIIESMKKDKHTPIQYF